MTTPARSDDVSAGRALLYGHPHGGNPGPRPFRFGVQASGPSPALSGSSSPGRSRTSATRHCPCPTTSATSSPSCRPSRPPPPRPPAAGGRPGVRQRLQAPRGAGQGDGHPRRAVRRAARVGIGAGWMTTDYEQSGFPMTGRRARRPLRGGAAVLKGLFADGPFTFAGRHYRITDLDGLPKPCSGPTRRCSSAAAVPGCSPSPAGRPTSWASTPPSRPARSAPTRSASMPPRPWTQGRLVREAAGARFGDLELNIRAFHVEVTDDREKAAADLGAFIGFTGEQVLASPFACIGTAGQIADDLRSAARALRLLVRDRGRGRVGRHGARGRRAHRDVTVARWRSIQAARAGPDSKLTINA